jgi:hypothetical protein
VEEERATRKILERLMTERQRDQQVEFALKLQEEEVKVSLCRLQKTLQKAVLDWCMCFYAMLFWIQHKSVMAKCALRCMLAAVVSCSSCTCSMSLLMDQNQVPDLAEVPALVTVHRLV